MDEEQIRKVIDDVFAKLDIGQATPQDKGRIMKELMPLVKGRPTADW